MKINWNKKLTTTYKIQCIITTCICEGGLGKILTCNVALKQWHKTGWNGDKRHKDGLNTDRDMPCASTYTLPPPPLPRQGLHVSECGLTCICTSHLQNALLEIQNRQNYRGNLPHACDLSDQYKTTNALWEWFFLSLYEQIHRYFW